MTSNQQTLTKEPEKLSSLEENKDTVEILDDALINAMKSDNKQFALDFEKFLINFVQSNRSNEVIQNMDKYQRKIVHKICDLYGVTREYVDVKPNDLGDITIARSSETAIPKYGLEKRYSKYLHKLKKAAASQSNNPLANKKVLIKPRVVKKTEPENESSGSSSGNEGNQAESKTPQDNDEQKKQQQYEEARLRIMQDKADVPVETSQQASKDIVEKPKKKGLRVDQTYDPDYDRNMAAIENSTSNIGFLPFPIYNQMFTQPTMNPYAQSFVPGYSIQGNFGSQQEYSEDFPPLSNSDNTVKKK